MSLPHRVAWLGIIYLALTACGTKGPLYIPEQRYPQQQPQEQPTEQPKARPQ